MRTPSYLVPPPPSPFRTQPHYSLYVRTLQPSELITHSQGWLKPYRGTPGTSLEMSKHSVQQFSGRMRSGKLRPLLVCRVCRRHQHYCSSRLLNCNLLSALRLAIVQRAGGCLVYLPGNWLKSLGSALLYLCRPLVFITGRTAI